MSISERREGGSPVMAVSCAASLLPVRSRNNIGEYPDDTRQHTRCAPGTPAYLNREQSARAYGGARTAVPTYGVPTPQFRPSPGSSFGGYGCRGI